MVIVSVGRCEQGSFPQAESLQHPAGRADRLTTAPPHCDLSMGAQSRHERVLVYKNYGERSEEECLPTAVAKSAGKLKFCRNITDSVLPDVHKRQSISPVLHLDVLAEVSSGVSTGQVSLIV